MRKKTTSLFLLKKAAKESPAIKKALEDYKKRTKKLKLGNTLQNEGKQPKINNSKTKILAERFQSFNFFWKKEIMEL